MTLPKVCVSMRVIFVVIAVLLPFYSAKAQRVKPTQMQEAEMYWQRAIANIRTAIEQQSGGMGSNYRAAREDFSMVIALVPRYADAYFMRSMVAFVMEDYHAAFEDMSAALRLRKSIVQNPPPSILRTPLENDSFHGMFALAAGQYVQADSLFAHSLYKNQLRQNGALYVYRALAQIGVGRRDAGCEDCRKAQILSDTKAKEVFDRYCANNAVVPDITFPQNFQFFARDEQDSASVLLSGVVNRKEIDSVYAVLLRKGIPVQRVSMPLVYAPSSNSGQPSPKNMPRSKKVLASSPARFALTLRLKAECVEHSLTLGVRFRNGADSIVAQRDSLVAGDVFLFAGQSNIVLGNVPSSPKEEFLRTYNNENNNAWWQPMAASNNLPGTLGHIGGLGGELARQIGEAHNIPICVIHGAVNGASIEMHMPMRRFPPQGIYDYTLNLARQSGLAKHIRGIVWYQGESNAGLGYAGKFAALYRAWKLDYPAVQRLYVVQIRPNSCNDLDQSDIREEQRRLPEFLPNVEVLAANAVQGYDGCHFSQQGYEQLAGQLFRLAERDFYGGTDTVDISSPSLRQASFVDSARRTVLLEFAPSASHITSSADSLIVKGVSYFLKDAFQIDGRLQEGNKSILDAHGWVESVEAQGSNLVRVRLREGIRAERISYIPNKFYPATTVVYDGPWLVTKRGVGVLSFFRASIKEP